MIYSLILFSHFGPPSSFPEFIILVIAGLLIYTLFFLAKEENIDKSKLNDDAFVDYDVLGQEVKFYHDKSNTYRPMRGNWTKGALLFILGFIAFVLVYRSSEKVKPIEGVSTHYVMWPSQNNFEFRPSVEKITYKLYSNPMFPSNFENIEPFPNKKHIFTSRLDNPINHVKVPYYKNLKE